MGAIKFKKEVSVLPETLEANTLYMVRTGVGFDLYVSDSTGSVAHKINTSLALTQQDDINTSTSYTINPTNGNIQKATATANFTLVFSGFTTGKYQEFKVYAANWGAYTFTPPTGLRFNGSTLPAFTVSGTDIVVIEKDKNEVFTLKLIAKNIGAI